MARQAELIKIAKSDTDRANIAAGKIRNYLALAVYSARDRDVDSLNSAVENLREWVSEFDDRAHAAIR